MSLFLVLIFFGRLLGQQPFKIYTNLLVSSTFLICKFIILEFNKPHLHTTRDIMYMCILNNKTHTCAMAVEICIIFNGVTFKGLLSIVNQKAVKRYYKYYFKVRRKPFDNLKHKRKSRLLFMKFS